MGKNMRNFKKDRYIFAGVITIIIFSLGFTLGIITSGYKLEYIERLYKNQAVGYESLQLQYLYLENIKGLEKNETCAIIKEILRNNLITLSSALEILQRYEKTGDINNEDYILLKRMLLLANIRYFLLAEKDKENCDSDAVSILYFYSKNCNICPDQGYILSQLKAKFEEKLLVFPIDTNMDEPIVNILVKQYDVKRFPTLIIEGKKIEKFLSMNEVLSEICPLYKEKYADCASFEK
jgi:thiol-disulfide isomerase/thioredoxin